MKWTQVMVDSHNAKVAAIHALNPEPVSDAVSEESDLHSQIMRECRSRDWVYFHGSMAHKTKRTLGEPDFVILMDGGQTLLVECKSRTGKLSNEQRGLAMRAAALGHEIHTVRSFRQFIQIINTYAK